MQKKENKEINASQNFGYTKTLFAVKHSPQGLLN